MISRPLRGSLCWFLATRVAFAVRTLSDHEDEIQGGIEAEDRSWDWSWDWTQAEDWIQAEDEIQANASQCDGEMGTVSKVPYLKRKFQMAVKPPAEKGVIVMQFNVLADGMGQNQFGASAKPHPGRFKGALAEIEQVSPDVLCMQEGNHFDEFWKPRMREIGYESVWIPKFHASYPKGFRLPPGYYRNAPSDGSAIFVKRDKFKLGKTVTKRFADITINKGMTQVIATVEVLEKASGKHVLTASTSHLKAGGHFDTRLEQGKAWVEFLEKEFRRPFVLTGDFNEDRHGHPKGGVNHLMKALALNDTYDVGLGKPPAFTCRWGTFDYILASEELQPRQLWSIPADRSRLPSSCYPSDHLALAVELVRQ